MKLLHIRLSDLVAILVANTVCLVIATIRDAQGDAYYYALGGTYITAVFLAIHLIRQRSTRRDMARTASLIRGRKKQDLPKGW